MFSPSGQEIEPKLFERECERDFTTPILLDIIEEIGEVHEYIRIHNSYNPDERRAGVIKDFEDSHDTIYLELRELLGDDDTAEELIGRVVVPDAQFMTDAECAEALRVRQEDVEVITDYLCGYQQTIKDKLAAAYGDSAKEDEINEDAWRATWQNFLKLLSDVDEEETPLADILPRLDGLVQEKYGKDYKHMERDRGKVVRRDICARTFYEVMEDHLARAIVGFNRDAETGYKPEY